MTGPLAATRGVGASELLRSVLPEAAVTAFAVLTWLGSVPFLVAVLALVYWFETREGGAVAMAAVLAGFGVTLVLKALLGLPRPPATLWLVEADGFGFPSGHAIAATVGWGAIAAVLPRGRRRQRVALAAVVVAVVALSRVVLGVHYAVDVVAGVVVGGALLGLLLWLDDVEWTFGIAMAAGLVAAVATDGGGDALLLLGATGGAWVAWSRLRIPSATWTAEDVLPAAGGAAAVGALLLAGYLVRLSPPVQLAVGAVAGALLVGLPTLRTRLVA